MYVRDRKDVKSNISEKAITPASAPLEARGGHAYLALPRAASILLKFELSCVRQKLSFLGAPQTHKCMRRQWILIGQSFLKTVSTIGDKKAPLGEVGTE